jgi:hypothetical protein
MDLVGYLIRDLRAWNTVSNNYATAYPAFRPTSLKYSVSKIALQLYFKCYSVANGTKTFTLRGVQTIYRSTSSSGLRRQRTAISIVPTELLLDILYTVYTPRKCIITLLSLHVSALLGHHQVTKVYNYDIKIIPIQRIRCYNILNRCSIIYIDIVS